MKINDYIEYWETDIKNATHIDKVFIVANESQLGEKIKSITKSEIFLVVIVPSSDANAPNVDDILENHTCLLYLLKFYNTRDKVDSDFKNALTETQDIVIDIKNKMCDDKAVHGEDHFMHYFEPNAMHTDPEYNYLGCNGWSLSFNLATPGF